jgi:CBS domain-containing protein
MANPVLPLMLVTVIADAIAVHYSRNSIMTEKLARRGLNIHQDYEPDVLHQVRVEETMSKEFDVVSEEMTVRELAERIGKHDPLVTRHQGVLIVDEKQQLAGIITRSDLMSAMEKDPSGETTVLDAGSRNPVVTYPDEVLYDAAARMLRVGVGRLPVVGRDDPKKVVGYLGRSGIMAARLRRLDEEGVRDPGWWKGRRPA